VIKNISNKKTKETGVRQHLPPQLDSFIGVNDFRNRGVLIID
jgi:hypothetical protein